MNQNSQFHRTTHFHRQLVEKSVFVRQNCIKKYVLLLFALFWSSEIFSQPIHLIAWNKNFIPEKEVVTNYFKKTSLQTEDTSSASTNEEHFPLSTYFAPNTFTFEFAGQSTFFGIAYERFYTSHRALRIGLGFGGAESSLGDAVALTFSGVYLTGNSPSRFEVSGGVSTLIYAGNALPNGKSIEIYPAVTVGYRIQPVDGGFVMRLGLTYPGFLMKLPYGISVGAAY